MSITHGTQTSRRRRLVALSMGLVLAGAVGEGWIRVFDLPPKPLPGLELGIYRLSANPILRYEYLPDQRMSASKRARDKPTFEINAAGFRDHSYELEKTPGVVRILALGDSITAGNGIRWVDATYPKVLERSLNSRAGPTRYQVLNFGIGGYNTAQEAELLRTRGLDYQPDVVTVAFCINDISWGADGGVYRVLKEQMDPEAVYFRTRSEITRRVMTNSRLAFFLYHRIGALLSDRLAPDPGDDLRIESSDPVDLGFEILAEVAREHSLEILVFLVPALDEPLPEYAYTSIHRRVLSTASKYPQLTVIDLTQAFLEAHANTTELSQDGIHPNQQGHEILARLIEPYITE